MFTGIVAARGQIETIEPLGTDKQAGLRLIIAAGGLDLSDVAIGDSIAIQGACMTVVALTQDHFTVVVSGHVDGLGEVVTFEAVGESWRLEILAPAAIGRYLAYKGSVVVDGVSLTVNEVHDTDAGTRIAINLIPHTFEVTTLGRLKPGLRVNLEIDLIARYVERMVTAPGAEGDLLKDLSRSR